MKTSADSVNLFTSNLREIEIHYRNNVKFSEMPKVTSSRDAADYLRTIWSPHMDRIEEFTLLCLNRANKVLGWAKISSGGLAGTVADPKVIFQVALKANASNIILCHNHPSGNLQPSEADISITRRIKESAALMDISLLDHVIVAGKAYFSLADENMI